MARLLEVSRSGYYAWAQRLPSKRAVRAERIEAKVAWFHGESDEVSGAPRILADLREDGEMISRKTVAKTMRKLGLRGICPRAVEDHHRDRRRRHLPGRCGQAGLGHRGPQRRLGRRHHLPADLGRVAVPGHRDRCHSRRVIGWAIADHMRTDLVEDALKMAITLRGELPAKVVFHTDRGTQYASEQITTFATENGITRSMGWTGICWDNAMAESFFATLKTEFYYRRVWPTQAGASTAVGAWIEDRYNRRRRHSSIGQISPVTFELQHCNQTAAELQAA